ncbi:long-chain-fatty-acid--CoA ligase 3-like [Venturia canescens]|uniref:long-chain-fatty-acid--CoA ligase 3-like n=1 Tax=Venturia canescens TaxID=32260 RepID=UPI001C9BFB85|nr:long-chain-fatty-acid--CoA ligase 3-like [Venturia canescens]
MTIIDQKKDLVKLLLGECVSLGNIEAELETCPAVENICVYGSAFKVYTVALVVPSPCSLEEIAANLNRLQRRILKNCAFRINQIFEWMR